MVKSVFQENDWEIPDELFSIELIVERVAAASEKEHLRRDQTTEEQRILGTRYVINVAKTSKLDIDVRDHVSRFSKYTSCSWRLAKSVLSAVKNGNEEQLLEGKTRCDAIHADTLWTDRIVQFM